MSDVVIQGASIVPVEETAAVAVTPQVSIFNLSPKKKVEFAAEVATVLADVIDKQNLYTVIQGKKHIRAEGWATLGTMLGVLPKEERVNELPDGSYEAWVNLISTDTGMVVGGASSLCGVDEKRWKSADRYARRSMAVTRATGKAYRLAFAFIPAMAGYATTPAEEMPVADASVYTGEDNQKAKFSKIAIKAGCPDEEAALKELSQECIGTPFKSLDGKIKAYLEEYGADTL